jgi:hypothetical protein
VCVAKAFTILTLAPTSLEMVYELQALHPSYSNSLYSNSLMGFESNTNVKLSMDYFKSIFLHMFHLSTSGLLTMVFEHIWVFFNPKD